MPRLRPIRALALATLTAALAGASPVAAATLQGRVLDPQRQPIAGARVRVQDEGRDLRRETTTDSGGAFTVAELPPGTYSVAAEASGFASATRRGLTVVVGQTYRLDVALALGGVTETVEAVAEFAQTCAQHAIHRPAAWATLGQIIFGHLPTMQPGRALGQPIPLPTLRHSTDL